MEFRRTLGSMAVAVALLGLAGASAVAGTIEGWNTDNVVTTTVPDADGNYFSSIYDQDVSGGLGSASTSGYIKFTPPESFSPGMEVENDAPPADGAAYADGDVYNCIVASSPNSSCNSDFQSGKRFKLDRTAFDPIDLVFNVDPNGTFSEADNDMLYKVFQKYGNNTGSSIESFTVELGFGLGGDFVASADDDGLGFINFGADPKENQFSSFYSAGLFGPGGTIKHPYIGYFSDERAGFNLNMVSEDLFQSAGMFGDYLDLFGDWMSYSMAPDGYFYDHDGDPGTDALLMAHFDAESGNWIINREILADGTIGTVAEGNNGTAVDTVADVEAELQTNITLPACDPDAVSNPPCLAGVDVIEDLAKFNLTYFLDVIDSELLATSYGSDITAFTLRITAVEAVAAPGVLSLLGLGLLGLSGVKRRLG